MPEPLNIIIIDDNPDDREHYIRTLKKVPDVMYRCLEASNGHLGIEMVNSRKCDCVLLDYSLPGVNGVDVLKNIYQRFPFLPVIMLTGQGNEAIAVQAIKLGACDYLTKPSITPERLHHAIQSAIEQSALKRCVVEKDKQIHLASVALTASEQRYELAVQGLSVGIWDWNILTNDLYWSSRFKEITGYEEDRPAEHYHDWETHLHPDDRERTLQMLFDHTKQLCPYDVEYRFYRRDGICIWIHAMGQALWDQDGTPLRMVGSIEDITWRKEAEVEKEKLITKLTESNSDLERFAYICSHDLQEPLRMISSFTQLLQRHLGSKLDDKGRHYMKYVTDGATQARQLISDVLNFARVDHLSEHLADVDSHEVLMAVLRDLSTRIEETGALITNDPMPVVRVQPTHLRQLLQNLISNGLKFCENKPCIHVSAQSEGNVWKFSVRDNGIGIAPEYQHKLFNIFQRLHHRGQYPGTGIGLAVCQKVVQKYGGKIWVESAQGQGSTFYFYLPAQTGQKQEAA